jgi:hypothetical protein
MAEREESMSPADFGESERDVVALRVIPVMPGGERPVSFRHSYRDAGWLARRGAHVGAVGYATGTIVTTASNVQANLVDLGSWVLHTPNVPSASTRDGKAVNLELVVLRSISDLLLRLSSPMIITCGGRILDLPFLRYRAFIMGASVPGLHLLSGNRLAYFDRFDVRWHVDLSELLAGYGATQPLQLAELCALIKLEPPILSDNLDDRAKNEALEVFLLFLRMLRVTGQLSEREYGRTVSDEANMRQT